MLQTQKETDLYMKHHSKNKNIDYICSFPDAYRDETSMFFFNQK